MYVPALYVVNKIDQITLEELEVMDRLPHYVPVSVVVAVPAAAAAVLLSAGLVLALVHMLACCAVHCSSGLIQLETCCGLAYLADVLLCLLLLLL